MSKTIEIKKTRLMRFYSARVIILILCTFFNMNLPAAVIKGEVAFSGETFNQNRPFSIDFKSKANVTTRWYLGDLFGETVLFAGVSIRNVASKPLKIRYFVAFYDEQGGLIATAAQGTMAQSPLGPGEQIVFGSCIVNLLPPDLAKIRRYEAIVYKGSSGTCNFRRVTCRDHRGTTSRGTGEMLP